MMTTDRQTPAADIKAEGVASEAALLTTFYCPRGKADPLYERLKSVFQQNPTNKPFPRTYDPPAAPDARVIMFAINAPKGQDAATAWETTRRELKLILDDKDLPKDWWGYTLTYQAVLNQDVDLARLSGELLPTVRRLD